MHIKFGDKERRHFKVEKSFVFTLAKVKGWRLQRESENYFSRITSHIADFCSQLIL